MDRKGTLIRHALLARPLGSAPTVLLLTVTMIEASFGALLVPAIGTTPLMEPGLSPADLAAITLTSITAGAEKENRTTVAREANALPQNHFERRHLFPVRRGLDNGYASVAG